MLEEARRASQSSDTVDVAFLPAAFVLLALLFTQPGKTTCCTPNSLESPDLPVSVAALPRLCTEPFPPAPLTSTGSVQSKPFPCLLISSVHWPHLTFLASLVLSPELLPQSRMKI